MKFDNNSKEEETKGCQNYGYLNGDEVKFPNLNGEKSDVENDDEKKKSDNKDNEEKDNSTIFSLVGEWK